MALLLFKIDCPQVYMCNIVIFALYTTQVCQQKSDGILLITNLLTIFSDIFGIYHLFNSYTLKIISDSNLNISSQP